MASQLQIKYPGRSQLGSPEHPDGAFQNETVPNASNFTPYEKSWPNNWLGFFDALLIVGEQTPNGNEDVATDSQRMRALQKLVGVERSYFTRNDAVNSFNYGVEYIFRIDAQETYTKIGTRATFTDAAGTTWGIPADNSPYANALLERLNIDLVPNLPPSDTFNPTNRSLLTTSAFGSLENLPPSDTLQPTNRSLITTNATSQLENVPIEDDISVTRRSYASTLAPVNAVDNSRGRGNAGMTTTSGLITLSGTFPDSGRMLVHGWLTARSTTEGVSRNITVVLPDSSGTGVASGSNREGNTWNVSAEASSIITGTPGTTRDFICSAVFDSRANWVSRRLAFTVVPV